MAAMAKKWREKAEANAQRRQQGGLDTLAEEPESDDDRPLVAYDYSGRAGAGGACAPSRPTTSRRSAVRNSTPSSCRGRGDDVASTARGGRNLTSTQALRAAYTATAPTHEDGVINLNSRVKGGASWYYGDFYVRLGIDPEPSRRSCSRSPCPRPGAGSSPRTTRS